ncbi:hypothetical protein M8C21_002692, partial [Ambrosia artemisiifolia]
MQAILNENDHEDCHVIDIEDDSNATTLCNIQTTLAHIVTGSGCDPVLETKWVRGRAFLKFGTGVGSFGTPIRY